MAAAIKQPGWIRGAVGALAAGAFGFGLVLALRAISDLPLYQTEQTGYPHVVVPLILAPLGFLAGFGCFDYWLRWAAGLPTIPEDHSQHGAKSWKDYFRFNTDHKVIGIQYVVTTFFFFFIGGLMAMLIRAELAQPGTQIVDAATFNSLFSTHAVLMIFVFVIPVFAGLANYVLPLMIGAPDMAFPRLNALSFWMLPLAGLLFGFIRGEGTEWRRNASRIRAYSLATWLIVAVLALRLIVQVPLYLADNIAALGTARVAMGVPLYALGLWFAWLVSRPALVKKEHPPA